MSFRFHRGPTVLTIFHDPTSASSLEALRLLRSVAGRTTTGQQGGVLAALAASSDKPDTSRIALGNDTSEKEYATAYLERLAREPAGSGPFGDIELEVQDRRRQPPTDSQMKSILAYLKQTPTPPDAEAEADLSAPDPRLQLQQRAEQIKLKAQSGEATATAATNTTTEDKAATAPPPSQASSLLKHLTVAENPAGAARIREGPIVVWWDEGVAATSVAGVEGMLDRVRRQGDSFTKKDTGGCVVA